MHVKVKSNSDVQNSQISVYSRLSEVSLSVSVSVLENAHPAAGLDSLCVLYHLHSSKKS